MKTIFYKEIEQENANISHVDYWFGQDPYQEWFTLENTLYEPHNNIRHRTLIPKDEENSYIKNITIVTTEDTFSDTGIIRRIALHIHK